MLELSSFSELADRQQWVTWATASRNGKPTKVPYTPGGSVAKVNDSNFWGSFEEALADFENNPRRNGIGFVLTDQDPFVVIDLDHCIVDGKPTAEAQSVIDRLDSYAELSPSKTGVHIWLKGQLQTSRNRLKWGSLEIELYSDGRYLTVTGDRLNDKQIEERTDQLFELVKDIVAPEPEPKASTPAAPSIRLDDQEIIDKMFASKHGHQIKTLWHGDISAYGDDDSRADLALASQIAFWTRDPEQIVRIMRLSSLTRKKWDKHPSYLSRTINKVLASKQDHYSGSSEASQPEEDPPADELTLKTPTGKSKGPSQAQSEWMLSRILGGDEGDLQLFVTSDNTTYIRLQPEETAMTWPTKSQQFRQYLRKRMFDLKGRAFRDEDLKRVVDTLDAQAAHGGQRQEAYLRVAPGPDGDIYLDLRNDDWDTVRITAEGWTIEKNPPALFRRGRNSAALPTPEHGGRLDSLRDFLNVDDEQWMLFASVMVSYISPDGPYPVLSISGEQGSGKSTACRIIKRLVDPAAAELYSMPDAKRDVLVAAQNNWVLAYENLSSIPPWLSDVFCILATGGGFSSRELYTDMDERVMSAQRPVVTNGIPELVTRPDLLSRAIPITLAPITNYRTERQFWAALDNVLPQALGGLLDAASAALANVDATEYDTRARMADFARWASAAAPVFGWTPYNFLDTYATNRETAEESVLETSSIATAIIAMAEARRHYNDPWVGTASELFDKITPNPVPKDWPKNARGLSSSIRRYAPVLRSQGVDIKLQRSGHSRTREIVISTADANLLDFASALTDFASAENSLRPQIEHDADAKHLRTQVPASSPNSEIQGNFGENINYINNIETTEENTGVVEKSPQGPSASSADGSVTILKDADGNDVGVII